jgi:hypothetical protein
LEWAWIWKTILKSAWWWYVVSIRNNNKNVIVRNLTINASWNWNSNWFEIVFWPDNILVENIEIFWAGKSNLIVRQESWSSDNITFNKINSHDAVSYHCISFRIVHWWQILNSKTYWCSWYWIDISTSNYIEMWYNYITKTMWTKYPAVDHLYAHNNKIIDNKVGDWPWLKIQRECWPEWHLHFENNIIKDNKVAVRDRTYSCRNTATVHFAELVFQNNQISWWETPLVAIEKVTKLEVYWKNWDLTPTKPANWDPQKDWVWYKTR